MHKTVALAGIAVALAISTLVWSLRSVRDSRLPEASTPIADRVFQPALPTPTPISAVSVDRVFAQDHLWARLLPPERTVTVIATGDVIPARSVNHKMVNGKGFLWPFAKTADVLRSADLTLVNLETPLFAGCEPTVEGMKFCGDARAADGLVHAGVDVATLGNNHSGNYGREGLVETRRVLAASGIEAVAEGPAYKTVKGKRFAFLSYDDIGPRVDGVPWADNQRVSMEIARVRKEADIVVVAFHWGVEYVTQPVERQRELAHLAVEAGADVVIGNHPHWIQPIEIYKDKFIIYAHGNFVFDQEWSEETKLGVVGSYTFFDGRLVDVEYMPVRIVEYGQPYFLTGEAKSRVLGHMRMASETLAFR